MGEALAGTSALEILGPSPSIEYLVRLRSSKIVILDSEGQNFAKYYQCERRYSETKL